MNLRSGLSAAIMTRTVIRGWSKRYTIPEKKIQTLLQRLSRHFGYLLYGKIVYRVEDCNAPTSYAIQCYQ